MVTNWGGGYEIIGWVGGMERWRWVEFLCEGEDNLIGHDDDGHDNEPEDGGDDDGRDKDYMTIN
jgi:hypothetical protein